MHKKFYEKIRDSFINLGKKHRIFLPIAVVGLALTMLITNICLYIKRSWNRLAYIAFIICFFFIGNSFAFPNFIFSNGFVDEAPKETLIAASESNINFATENDSSVTGTEENYDDVLNSESNQILEDSDLVYLDDMLDDIDESTTSETEEESEFQKDDWRLILINKQHPIPEDYAFNLGSLSGSMQCDERIINDLLLMVKKAKEDDVSLVICSPYRDLERQKMLFNRKIDSYMNNGYSYMEAYKLSSQAVTIPGSSEHQVGLAIDIVTTNYTYLDEGFENTDAGKWLKEHCDEYGFILRYPKDKEYITSIEYEPWHFRYVGTQAAKVIMENGICLEEFWENYL